MLSKHQNHTRFSKGRLLGGHDTHDPGFLIFRYNMSRDVMRAMRLVSALALTHAFPKDDFWADNISHLGLLIYNMSPDV